MSDIMVFFLCRKEVPESWKELIAEGKAKLLPGMMLEPILEDKNISHKDKLNLLKKANSYPVYYCEFLYEDNTMRNRLYASPYDCYAYSRV